jgi:hypothetical protein
VDKQNHTPEDKSVFKYLSSFEARIRKVSARKRIAADEQDHEGDSESDPTAAGTPAPAKKHKDPAEKRKMVARSETEAEERTVAGKKKRKSDVAASTAAEGDEQDEQSFVSVRAEEPKKSRARCV